MINSLLSHYYDNPPATYPIEDYNIDEHELHYYLVGCTATKDKYLAILQNGYEYNDFIQLRKIG